MENDSSDGHVLVSQIHSSPDKYSESNSIHKGLFLNQTCHLTQDNLGNYLGTPLITQ